MSSRSKWEDMANYPSDLAWAIKDARAEGAKKEAASKAAQYVKEAESRASAPKESAKAEPAKKKGEDISIGGTLEKVKARNRMLSDL